MSIVTTSVKHIMQTIKASEFKAKCLSLMDHVNETGEELIVTKNGKPVSKLVPYKKCVETLYGFNQGIISIQDDLIEPLDEHWDAQ